MSGAGKAKENKVARVEEGVGSSRDWGRGGEVDDGKILLRRLHQRHTSIYEWVWGIVLARNDGWQDIIDTHDID